MKVTPLLLISLFVGCQERRPSILLPDSSPAMGGCNVLTQTGECTGDVKCTWIRDQQEPPIGHVGCAPNGTIPIGGACTEPAWPTRYDDCVKGSACLAGECKQICDVNGGVPTCDQNHACTRYADVFESGGTAVAGVCAPSCDPLTQELKVGTNKAACGSTMPAMPNSGCYGFDEFSCAPTDSNRWTLTDRQPPQTNAVGNPYLNGCAPGFIPFLHEGTGSTVTLCSGLCAALEIDNTAQHSGNSLGNTRALGKNPTEATPMPGHATCDSLYRGSNGGAAGPSSCRFIWPYLVDDATGELPAAFDHSIYKDTLGVCFSYTRFRYDSNGDGQVTDADMVYPDCATLPPRSGATPEGDDDAADWGCQTVEHTAFTGAKRALTPAMRDVRVPKQLEKELVRHSIR